MAKFFALFVFFTLLAISIMLQPTLLHASQGGHHHSNNQKPNGHYGPGSLKSSQCPSQCSRRCGKTQYHKPCMFFCQKCCRKCLCVPPGYYGNKAVCPCYNNWKTKEGGPKCP
ncbi:PREDICTED: gibberellin-regulated protein 4-like [Ipomoea nil]|uniref:gibberellin-regulated protein 4-like n=1 Tax=Ipomoea nil TaxID=35883 RepID=UPI000901B3E2|nr:PREDICTED: gibberellin-regulated protein 4-like [Ipomoea nil]